VYHSLQDISITKMKKLVFFLQKIHFREISTRFPLRRFFGAGRFENFSFSDSFFDFLKETGK